MQGREITSKVVLLTVARDAERTLARTIESCLAQTFGDFTYLLIDNGSEDGTRAIIQRYVKLDDRIMAKFFENNDWYRMFDSIKSVLTLGNGIEYVAVLDADDEYKPEFLEEMHNFVSAHGLGVAFCGTDWIDANSGALVQQKVPAQDIILEGRDFLDRFPDYRPYALRIWGGLYSRAVLKRMRISLEKLTCSIGDTTFVLEALRNSGRAGFYARSLHKYYIGDNTATQYWNVKILFQHKCFHKFIKRYMKHFGELNQQNLNYLHVLRFISLKYIWDRILNNPNVGIPKKLEIIGTIFSDTTIRRLFRLNWQEVGIRTVKSEFINEVRNWVELQRNSDVPVEILDEIFRCLLHCEGDHHGK